MFIENCWYVAAWDHEIAPDGMFARKICGRSLVFWRSADGAVHAFDDRCCHRGAPLSCGRREGDHVRCLYHGFLYDTRGVCVEIPGQDRVPAKAAVRRYAVVERDRWVWIWLGAAEAADATLIPDAHWLVDPAWGRTPQGYLHYDVDYQLINDNLLDFSHLSYVHPTTLGGSEEYAQLRSRIDRLERGLHLERWFLDRPAAPFVARLLATRGLVGNVDRWNCYDFLLPGVLLMDSGFAPAGSGAEEGRRQDAIQFRNCQAVTPETERSAHYFFCQARDFDRDSDDVGAALFESLLAAFEEDRAIITAQMRALAEAPSFEPVPCGLDLGPTLFRRLVERELAKEHDARAAVSAARPAAGRTSAAGDDEVGHVGDAPSRSGARADDVRAAGR